MNCSSPEVYARSTRIWARLGEVAIAGAPSREAFGVEWEARSDFSSALAENLADDPVMREFLDVERERSFDYQDGHVVMADGTTVIDMVRRGLDASRVAATRDPAMALQAERDEGDVGVAERVDQLEPGQLYIAVSMAPAEALDRYPRKFEALGYRLGWSYLQTYYRTEDGDKVIASSFSVKHDDRTAWSRTLSQYGMEIPADMPSGQWIRHGAVQYGLSAEVALAFAAEVRDNYYEAAGVVRHHYSVSGFVTQNTELVDRYFAAYIRPLAEAIYTQASSRLLQDFAQGMVSYSAAEHFQPEVRQALSWVAANGTVPRQFAPIIESLVRYAVVEELRTRLLPTAQRQDVWVPASVAQIRVQPEYLASRVAEGVAAGRSYGGCASLELSRGPETSTAGSFGTRQEVFGGRAGKDEDDLVPSIIHCIRCRKPAPKQVVVKPRSWRCPHCTLEVDVCTGVTIHASNLDVPPVPPKVLLLDQLLSPRPRRSNLRTLGGLLFAA